MKKFMTIFVVIAVAMLVGQFPAMADPVIDGVLSEGELSDASFQHSEYQVEGMMNAFDIWWKTVLADDVPYLYLATKISNPAIEAGTSSSVSLYFDEGNNSPHGSGSRDLSLTDEQEDWKRVGNGATWSSACLNFYGITEGCPDPSCTPDNQSNCWRCSQDGTTYGDELWKGYHCEHSETHELVTPLMGKRSDLGDGYKGWSMTTSFGAYDRVNFRAYKKAYSSDGTNPGHVDAEFLIPLAGVEADSGPDHSDLTVNYGDTIGIGIVFGGLNVTLDQECVINEQCPSGSLCIGVPFNPEIPAHCEFFGPVFPETLNSNNASTYAEIAIPTPNLCGNGMLDPGEQCDPTEGESALDACEGMKYCNACQCICPNMNCAPGSQFNPVTCGCDPVKPKEIEAVAYEGGGSHANVSVKPRR